MKLYESPKEIERRIRLQGAKAKKAIGGIQQEPQATCFAGFGPVCSDSLTPNVKKAERLRRSKYW